MVKPSSRRVVFSAGVRSARVQSLSKQKLELLHQLLELLRSGALNSFLANVGVPTSSAQRIEDSSQKPPVSSGGTIKSKSKGTRTSAATDGAAISPRDSSEWKSVKRVTSVTSQTKDKLLSEN